MVNTVLVSEIVQSLEYGEPAAVVSEEVSLLEYQAPAQINIAQIVSVLEYQLGVNPPDEGGTDPGGPPGGGGLLGDLDICSQL